MTISTASVALRESEPEKSNMRIGSPLSSRTAHVFGSIILATILVIVAGIQKTDAAEILNCDIARYIASTGEDTSIPTITDVCKLETEAGSVSQVSDQYITSSGYIPFSQALNEYGQYVDADTRNYVRSVNAIFEDTGCTVLFDRSIGLLGSDEWNGHFLIICPDADDTPTVSLSAEPNPVAEGSSVTVTATLSAALDRTVRIPLTLTAGNAEAGDYGTLDYITIVEGSRSGEGTIGTTADADTDNETFTVALNTEELERLDHATVLAGRPSAVEVTISDSTVPTVSLSVAPNPVAEGSSVTVTATLSAALDRTVRIPLTLTAGNAEANDYGALDYITIVEGSRSGEGTIGTTADADAEDETFTVALGTLPETVTAGTPNSVSVTVIDGDLDVRLSVSTLTVQENGTGTYTVALTGAPDQGATVTVTLASDNPDVGISPASLTFSGGAGGDWNIPQTVTVTALPDEDADNDVATITHSVAGLGGGAQGGAVTVTVVETVVENVLEQQTVQRTVAAVAASTVSNVTSNIGARFSAPTGGATLSLAGTPVAFAPMDPKSLESLPIPNGFDGRDGDGWPTRHRTMTGGDLLRSSSFEVALGASQSDKDPVLNASNRLTVWGRGDFQFFESGGGRKPGYDGNLLAGYLGADLATDGGWLFGLAVSRIMAEADYTLGGAGAGGKLEAELTNVHPYVRLALGEKTEIWTILGVGAGEVTNETRQGESASDLSMKMVSAGGRQGLMKVGGVDLALLADGSSATVETDDGVQSIDGLSADVWRVRVGAEVSHTVGWDDGSALTSFLEVAGRRDGGDGVEGEGLEVSPGLAFSDPESGFAVEARGRMLALHSAEDHREYGASITASLAPGAHGHGLSLAVTPTWGTMDGSPVARGAGLSPTRSSGRRSDSLSLNSRVAYGFAVGTGVLAPFADVSLRDGDSHRMRAGSRYGMGPSANVELAGELIRHASERSERAVHLSARLRF